MTTNTEATGQSPLEQLYAQDRVLITAKLALTNGHFLQPTGFPDIEACIYRDKEGKRRCLVESEQSMSNRLEAVSMRSPGVWVDDLRGLPLIAVKNRSGDLLATNLTEPHRLASSYVLDGKRAGSDEGMRALFESKLGLQNDGNFWPLDKRADLEKLVFALDPAALLHGFQFVQWKFVGLRQTRLIHARLEAELADEPEVHYGMVKWDAIEPESTREERANKGQSIAAKSRIVPKDIAATFEIDVLALKSLSLEEGQKKFLLGLGLWKVGAFLANKASFDPRSRSTGPSLRLRADCYLTCDPSISWSGNSATGTTTTTDLMAARLRFNFKALVEEMLSDAKDAATTEPPKEGKSSGKKGAATDKKSSAEEEGEADGPLVQVTYEPKPKQGRKGGRAQEADANVVQADDQQG